MVLFAAGVVGVTRRGASAQRKEHEHRRADRCSRGQGSKLSKVNRHGDSLLSPRKAAKWCIGRCSDARVVALSRIKWLRAKVMGTEVVLAAKSSLATASPPLANVQEGVISTFTRRAQTRTLESSSLARAVRVRLHLRARSRHLLGYQHFELDALFWGPNWTARPTSRNRGCGYRQAVLGDGRQLQQGARQSLAARDRHHVWLNYPFLTIYRRRSRELFGGSSGAKRSDSGEFVAKFRESTFLASDGIAWVPMKTYGRRKRNQALFAEPRFQGSPRVRASKACGSRGPPCPLMVISNDDHVAKCQANGRVRSSSVGSSGLGRRVARPSS